MLVDIRRHELEDQIHVNNVDNSNIFRDDCNTQEDINNKFCYGFNVLICIIYVFSWNLI